jgi:hypothetical protein
MSTHPVRDTLRPRRARGILGLASAGAALVLAFALSACGGGGNSEVPLTDSGTVAQSTAPAPALVLVRVNLPVHNWTAVDGQHVVRNAGDWARIWDAHNGVWPAQSAPPLPAIDFKDTMLVGVTSAYGGCSGHIAILSAEREPTPAGEAWVVHFQVDEHNPMPGMACTDDIKPMADFVLLPQSALPVRFVELPRLH